MAVAIAGVLIVLVIVGYQLGYRHGFQDGYVAGICFQRVCVAR